MKKIKIGIIGTGVGIRTHLKGFRSFKLENQAEVVAICGSSYARSQEFAKQYGIPVACSDYEELCSNPEIDLVCVTPPNRFHLNAVKCAIKYNKHIICEKPLSDDLAEAEELAQIVKTYPKIAVVDHQLRYNPYVEKIKEFIENGTIGQIYYIRLNQQGTGFAKEDAPWIWSFDGTQGGGVRLAMASHFTDLIQYWFNNPKILNVTGYLNPVTKQRKNSNGVITDVTASTICTAQIGFSNELCAQYYINAGSYEGSRFDVTIFGDKGEIRYSLDKKLEVYYRDSVSRKVVIDVPNVFEDERQNTISIFSGSFRYFAPMIIKAIRDNDYSYISKSANFNDALYNLKLLNAIQKSANTGQAVVFDKEVNTYV